ncbi:MAG: flagellar basal-body MS-ring/collar protein FliF [Verrucomicrobiota bacterium]|nr:flagellar basal-body MS-ring/collar protein FliF [Limisphaera sp.]MDW8381045.1 flagellar basal-body MS-ring/collar protein FliF [Verrucomicrobiota bacterium]
MNLSLTRLGAQLVAIWRELGWPQRLTLGAAALVVVGGLAGMALWSTRTPYALLYGRLSDAEASRVIRALDEAKIPYRISGGGGAIYVPADQVHAVRMQLAGRGIPRSDGVGFEIFDKPNFGISDFVQRANYLRALQGELARTISQLDEVESARVMVVLPENRLLLDRDKQPTASVFVRLRGPGPLPPQAVNSIRFLVANAVEGLKPNRVTVVDNFGNVLSENSEDNSLPGLTASQLAVRRELEQYLARKAQDMLDKIVGHGQAIVRVSAEINFDTLTRTEERFDPDGQVVRTQTKNDENTDTVTTTPTVPVGISANTATDTNATATPPPVTNTRNRKTTTTVEYELGRTVSNLTQMAGGIKRLSAAVTLAARVEGTGTERKVAPRSPEELEKIRRLVAGALGIPLDAENPRGDVLTVEELPFEDSLGQDLARELQRQQRWEFWWAFVRQFGYPLLAVALLVFLWRMLQRSSTPDIPLGVPVGQLLAHGNGHGNGHGRTGSSAGSARVSREAETPDTLTLEVLNRLARENPVNLSHALREWMNKGRPQE